MSHGALISLFVFFSVLCAGAGRASAESPIDLRSTKNLDNFDGCTLHAKWDKGRLMLLGRHIRLAVPSDGRIEQWGASPNLVFVQVGVSARVLETGVTKLALQVLSRADEALDGRYWLSSPEPTEQILRHLQERLPHLRFFLGKAVGLDVPDTERAYYGLPTSITPSFSKGDLLEPSLYDSAWLVISKGPDGSNTMFVPRCQNMMPNPAVNRTLRDKAAQRRLP